MSSPYFFLIDSIHIAFKIDNSSADNEYSIKVTDLEGNVLQKVKNNNRQNSLGTSKLVPIYFYENSLRFKDIIADTLFSFQNSDLKPIAVFNFGDLKKYDFTKVQKELKLNRDPEKNEQINNMYSVIGISENLNFLFIKVLKGLNLDQFYYVIFRKQTRETFPIGKETLINDIDGGLPFWPLKVFNDSLYVDFVEANDFREQLLGNKSDELDKKYKEKYLNLIKFAESIKEEDNPILIIAKP